MQIVKAKKKPTPLNVTQKDRLHKCEKAIASKIDSFMEVGEALAEIKADKLYRESFGTFEEYCEQKWNFTARRANQIIKASEVVADVGTTFARIVGAPPSCGQASALAEVPEEDRADVLKAAKKAAKDEGAKTVTIDAIKKASEKIESAKKTGNPISQFSTETESSLPQGEHPDTTAALLVVPQLDEAVKHLRVAKKIHETLLTGKVPGSELLSSSTTRLIDQAIEAIQCATPARQRPESSAWRPDSRQWVTEREYEALTSAFDANRRVG